MKQEQRSMRLIWKLAVFWSLALLAALWLRTNDVQAADMLDAPTVALDGKWSRDYWITDDDTQQYYRVVIPSDGKLIYKVMGYGRVWHNFCTEDDFTSLKRGEVYGSASEPATWSYTLNLSAGTYYLSAYQKYDGYTGKYKLNFSFESFGTNDGAAISYDSPQTLPLNTKITGALTETDRADWYRIQIPTNGTYKYQISTYFSVEHYLWTADLSKRIYYDYIFGKEASCGVGSYEVTLSPGVYYMKIGPRNAESGKYTLNFSPLNKNNCNHSYQTTSISATFTAKGYDLHKCKKCGYSYKDHYTAKRQLSAPPIYGLQAGKKKAKISWLSVSNASGYLISCKCGRVTKTYEVKKASVTRKTIKKLKSKKKCVFRVRAYRKEGGVTVYSKWSKKRSVKIR